MRLGFRRSRPRWGFVPARRTDDRRIPRTADRRPMALWPKVAQAGTEKAGPGPRCELGAGEPAMRGWARPFCLPGRTDAVRA